MAFKTLFLSWENLGGIIAAKDPYIPKKVWTIGRDKFNPKTYALHYVLNGKQFFECQDTNANMLPFKAIREIMHNATCALYGNSSHKEEAITFLNSLTQGDLIDFNKVGSESLPLSPPAEEHDAVG